MFRATNPSSGSTYSTKHQMNKSMGRQKSTIVICSYVLIGLLVQGTDAGWTCGHSGSMIGCYDFIRTKVTFQEATSQCEAIGGSVVSITSQGEQNFIEGLLSKEPDTRWWISLNDRAQEDVWNWSSGEIVSYTNWESGEPNNAGGENCVAIKANFESQNRRWNDVPCSLYKNAAICEKVVNGGWSSWGGWHSCSRSCGYGTKYRYRSCNNPSRRYGGSDCYGSSYDSTSCFLKYCPTNGGWSSWNGWSSCSQTCGSGTKIRSRSCSNPYRQHGGSYCSGSSSDSTSCWLKYCQINGGWSLWSSFGECDKTCGAGLQTRQRTCSNPPPQYNGNRCSGASESSANCSIAVCPPTQPAKKIKIKTFKKLGCYYDFGFISNRRPFTYTKDMRTKVNWYDNNKSFDKIVADCSVIALDNGWEYFAIEYFGECWTGPGEHFNYTKDGASTDCYKGRVGKGSTMFAYKWE